MALDDITNAVRGPESKKEELTVEIGCGVRSILSDAPDEYLSTFKENPFLRYVALDINEADVTEAEEIFRLDAERRLGSAAEHITFKRASATELPFENDSVTEVKFTNILGDPNIGLEQKSKC